MKRRHRQSITRGCRAYVARAKAGRTTPYTDDDVRALYAAGSTLQDIGDLLGVSRERVRQRIARSGPPIDRAHALDPLDLLAKCRAPDTTCYAHVRVFHHNYAELKRALDALGVRDAVERLWRIRKMRPTWARRRQLVATIRRLATELGRRPTVHEIAVAEGKVNPTRSNCGAYIVGLWLGPDRKRRTAGTLGDIWRAAGYGEQIPRGYKSWRPEAKAKVDKVARGTCRNGHPWIPANRYPSGTCRLCDRARKGYAP